MRFQDFICSFLLTFDLSLDFELISLHVRFLSFVVPCLAPLVSFLFSSLAFLSRYQYSRDRNDRELSFGSRRFSLIITLSDFAVCFLAHDRCKKKRAKDFTARRPPLRMAVRLLSMFLRCILRSLFSRFPSLSLLDNIVRRLRMIDFFVAPSPPRSRLRLFSTAPFLFCFASTSSRYLRVHKVFGDTSSPLLASCFSVDSPPSSLRSFHSSNWRIIGRIYVRAGAHYSFFLFPWRNPFFVGCDNNIF